jgi:hypothetical protein
MLQISLGQEYAISREPQFVLLQTNLLSSENEVPQVVIVNYEGLVGKYNDNDLGTGKI